MEENGMRKERKNYTGTEKVGILREHLLEGVAVSELCERYGLRPALFYRWQKEFFENGAAAFEVVRGRPKRQEEAQAHRIEALEAKLKQKNDVMAELLQEHIQLKKGLGEL
jgi:transposase